MTGSLPCIPTEENRAEEPVADEMAERMRTALNEVDAPTEQLGRLGLQ